MVEEMIIEDLTRPGPGARRISWNVVGTNNSTLETRTEILALRPRRWDFVMIQGLYPSHSQRFTTQIESAVALGRSLFQV